MSAQTLPLSFRCLCLIERSRLYLCSHLLILQLLQRLKNSQASTGTFLKRTDIFVEISCNLFQKKFVFSHCIMPLSHVINSLSHNSNTKFSCVYNCFKLTKIEENTPVTHLGSVWILLIWRCQMKYRNPS